jgi:hypothetical protein
MRLDSYTCKECGAFFSDKKLAAGHVCSRKCSDFADPDFSGIGGTKEGEKIDPVVAPTVKESAPVVENDKLTLSALQEMKLDKPKLIVMAEKAGINKISGKYLQQCRAEDIEAAIIEKQGE